MKAPRHTRGLRDGNPTSRRTRSASSRLRWDCRIRAVASRIDSGRPTLAARIERLLDSAHPQSVFDALDRLNQTDAEAYGTLIESVEAATETIVIEVDGKRWDCLLVSAPLVAWTRFRIPSGPFGAMPPNGGDAPGRRTCWPATCG